MTPSWADVERLVKARAGDRYEYCRMHQAFQGATFHVEHIVPKSAGGSDDPDNLAWACPACNLTKSNRVSVPDLETGSPLPLFNPRTNRWTDHFAWDGYAVVGLTPIGHAVIAAFDLNNPRRLKIRQAEEFFDLFPPR